MQLRIHKYPCNGAELEVHIPPDRPIIPAVVYAGDIFGILTFVNSGNINPPGVLRIPAPHGHIPADVQPAVRSDPLRFRKTVRPFSVIFTIDTDIDIPPHCDVPGFQPYRRGAIMSFKEKIYPGVLFYIHIPANSNLAEIVGYMPAIIGSTDNQFSRCPSVRHFHPAVFLSSQVQVSGDCQFAPVSIYAEIYISPVHLPFIGAVQAYSFRIYGNRLSC